MNSELNSGSERLGIDEIDYAIQMRMVKKGLDLPVEDIVGVAEKVFENIYQIIDGTYGMAFVNTEEPVQKMEIYRYPDKFSLQDRESMCNFAQGFLLKEVKRLEDPKYSLAAITTDAFGQAEIVRIINISNFPDLSVEQSGKDT